MVFHAYEIESLKVTNDTWFPSGFLAKMELRTIDRREL